MRSGLWRDDEGGRVSAVCAARHALKASDLETACRSPHSVAMLVQRCCTCPVTQRWSQEMRGATRFSPDRKNSGRTRLRTGLRRREACATLLKVGDDNRQVIIDRPI